MGGRLRVLPWEVLSLLRKLVATRFYQEPCTGRFARFCERADARLNT
jgi:hypothetical protein